MIKIISTGDIKRIAVVKSYAGAQDYAEQNRLPAGEYILKPPHVTSLAGLKTLRVGYEEVDGILEPWTEIES